VRPLLFTLSFFVGLLALKQCLKPGGGLLRELTDSLATHTELSSNLGVAAAVHRGREDEHRRRGCGRDQSPRLRLTAQRIRRSVWVIHESGMASRNVPSRRPYPRVRALFWLLAIAMLVVVILAAKA
jgi:hypothetical protein